ncbi:hypothetical protein Salat_1421000 [Sesamum alatum]|uniref:Uncharacterized protein n=1 Tax=Sesamum alatum TaxID=300844 RepID=A0AAE1YAM8_9LAMI|nr:hypothetical protein Salat_1421000 [Sesamum alatum]
MGLLGQAAAAPKREAGCRQVAANQPRLQAWAVGLAERGNVQAGSKRQCRAKTGKDSPTSGCLKLAGKMAGKPRNSASPTPQKSENKLVELKGMSRGPRQSERLKKNQQVAAEKLDRSRKAEQ